MATFHRTHRAALLAASAVVLGLVAGCDSSDIGAAPPSARTSDTADTSVVPSRPGSAGSAGSPAASPSGGTAAGTRPGGAGTPSAPAGSADGTSPTRAGGTRCHTSDLRASVGRNDPGAGQENFPVVLTNTSARTCTVRGYPGAAFTDPAGRQLGPDPRRAPTLAVQTVTLKPGGSAWAGLSFSNPRVSGATAKTPALLLVTPPDEWEQLRVAWRGGPVPVSGNSSTVSLTALAPGSGV